MTFSCSYNWSKKARLYGPPEQLSRRTFFGVVDSAELPLGKGTGIFGRGETEVKLVSGDAGGEAWGITITGGGEELRVLGK
jgi:hypothetical protein